MWILANTAGQATQIIEDGQLAAETVASAFDQMWQDVIGTGGLYAAIAQLGIFFAVGTLVFWAVNLAKALLEDDYLLPLTDIVWPMLVITLLANNGQLLATGTLALRGIINDTNKVVLASTSSSVRLGDAYKQIMQEVGKQDVAEGLVSQCSSIADPTQQQSCLADAQTQAQQMSGSGQTSGFQKFLDGIGSAFSMGNVLSMAVRGWLLAFGIAFQWIVEVSMLLTGLLGPLAVGGTLLPVGQKSIFAWLTGFFSIGMAKLSFNIICGLVATMIVNAGSNDPMIFAFATGILAPVLSLVLASGGGMAVFNSLSSMATFGAGRLLPFGLR